jgi:hypothetical protein
MTQSTNIENFKSTETPAEQINRSNLYGDTYTKDFSQILDSLTSSKGTENLKLPDIFISGDTKLAQLGDLFNLAEPSIEAQSMGQALLDNRDFSESGKLDDNALKILNKIIGTHSRDLDDYNLQLNKVLEQQNSPYRLDLSVQHKMEGMHGNTVDGYFVQVTKDDKPVGSKEPFGKRDTVRGM